MNNEPELIYEDDEDDDYEKEHDYDNCNNVWCSPCGNADLHWD